MDYNKLRIIFFGTSHVAATLLEFIISLKFFVCTVVTRADYIQGRGKKPLPSPVKNVARLHVKNIFESHLLNSNDEYEEIMKHFKKVNINLAIVADYGSLLPLFLLKLPQYGFINIHLSLLPKFRGAAPVQSALKGYDRFTGVTIIKINEYLDEGDILYQDKISILKNDTILLLNYNLIKVAKVGIAKVLENIINYSHLKIKQHIVGASYASKILKHHGLINWSSTADIINRQVRSFILWPGSFTLMHGVYVKIFNTGVLNFNTDHDPGYVITINKFGMQVQTQTGILLIKCLQYPGKKVASIKSALNSVKLIKLVGTKFITAT